MCYSRRIAPCFHYPGIEIACPEVYIEIICPACQASTCSTKVTVQEFFRHSFRLPDIVVEPIKTFQEASQIGLTRAFIQFFLLSVFGRCLWGWIGNWGLTESDSSSDDLTRLELSQYRSTARRQPRSDDRSATADLSSATPPDSTPSVTTVLGQELTRPPSLNDPETRYLSYSSTPVVTVPEIDIQDEGDSGDVDVSLTGETHSAIGSVSPFHGSTALLDRHFSDSDSSITIPVRQVANRVLATADYDNLPPLHQPRDRWIPTYLAPSRRVASEIAPWSVSRIPMVCVRTMSIEWLFHH